ncbi:MAG: IPT/TIG domain protein, partial [Cyclobacteriaceae bacterium]|nr:IPT/TIG domain protein [Cyclobacteriaceae bacterium]
LAFEIGQKLYVVGGLGDEATRGFALDMNLGAWNSIPNAPFAINNAVLNFSYQNKHYFIDPETNMMHAFNTFTNVWEEVSRYPGDLGNGTGVGVVIGNRAYLGLGNRSDQMWELNMETFNWVRKNDFPGSTVSRNSGVFEHGGLIYILRSAEVQLSGVSEFWVFDPNAF